MVAVNDTAVRKIQNVYCDRVSEIKSDELPMRHAANIMKMEAYALGRI